MTRRTAGGALLTVLALLLSSVGLIASPSQAAPGDATISATPNTGLGENTLISVSGNAGPLSTDRNGSGAGAVPDTSYPFLYISMCKLPLTASSCDTDISNGIGSSTDTNPATAPHVVRVLPDTEGDWGPINFLARRTLVNGDGTFDCSDAANQCVIGSANAPRPVDHSYDATQNLEFTTSTSTATPTATATSTPTATATSTPTATATSTPTSTSGSGGLSIIATPNSELADGQIISVRGNAGKKNAPPLYVAVCTGIPTATNCDTDLTDFGTPDAHILQVRPDPATGAWGPFDFKVRQNVYTGDNPDDGPAFDCKAVPTCVIGTTNAANPADRTYNVTTPLTFSGDTVAPSTPATTSPADGSGGDGGSGDGGADGAGDTLAMTGNSVLTPLLLAVGVAAILAGLILILANPRRRRPTHL